MSESTHPGSAGLWVILCERGKLGFAQRQAKMLAASSFVPREFQGNNGVSNCVVAVGVARRMGMDPAYVCQSINVLNGRPSWKSEFISGAIQGCGRFTDFGYVETEDSCRVVCKRADGEGLAS